MTDLSSRLASGDTLYGTFLGLGSALAAEACALAGFDWLLTDLEHGGGDESELLPQQLAADAHGVPMLVRVESTHRIRAGHALDLGAAGIMFPGIESADQATHAEAGEIEPLSRRQMLSHEIAQLLRRLFQGNVAIAWLQ